MQSKSTLGDSGQRRSAARPRPLLRWLHTPTRGVIADESLSLRPGRYPMGREVEPDDGVRVDDPRVSRTHATLHVVSRSLKVRIADEGSRHGTWVNGKRITEAWLDDGDVIRLGDAHLLLRYQPPDDVDADVAELIGVSPATAALRASIAQVAPHEVTVMILGASGTGKEVVARAIHERSVRSGPFVAINCAAIVEQLAESQLFGHVSGAFTGAVSDQPGFFRAADGGTVFLDEIGDLPTAMQPKLLRALEQREVVPVGGTSPIAFDARVVVATHRDLVEQVKAEQFRGDLYARLAQFRVDVPPLCERREDVLPLLQHALGDLSAELAPDLVEALLGYHWPFNVREVFSVAGELRVRQREGRPLTADLVEHRLDSESDEPVTSSDSGDDRERLETPTREQFLELVEEHRGNVRALARATGRSRMQIYRWVEQFGLDLDVYRRG